MNKMGTLNKHKAEVFISFHCTTSGCHCYITDQTDPRFTYRCTSQLDYVLEDFREHERTSICI